jgi:hypothetical protein
MDNICCVPVSIGELFDKYTILLIKKENIKNTTKLDMVLKEINYLYPYINKYNIDNIIINELKEVNNELWIIEDKIRIKEQKKEFDNEFIELARSVYITNDKRSQIKNKINYLLNSSLTDIKSYVNYNNNNE